MLFELGEFLDYYILLQIKKKTYGHQRLTAN